MLRRNHINEARILQNVDPKLKASMSSMLSNLNKKGESSENQKPPRKDTQDVLLQKYIIGLLKTGSECPETVADISRIGTFKLYGQAYIDNGGSMSDIQNMYVDNGGTVNFEIKQNFPPYEDNNEVDNEPKPGIDFPEFNDVPDVPEQPRGRSLADLAQAANNNRGYQGYSQSSEDIEEIPVEDEAEDSPIESYMKSMFRQVENAYPGDYIIFDEDNGLMITDEETNAICVCVASRGEFIDHRPRFMFLQKEPAKLDVPGNKGKYEDFYFKASLNDDDHYDVIPGNKYHYKEGINGLNYTKVLLALENGPAIYTKTIANRCLNFLDPSSEQIQTIVQYLKENTYLPTLFELSKAVEFLDEGRYWTSSVTNNGRCSIAYEISYKGDRFIKGDRPDDIAIVTAFVKI